MKDPQTEQLLTDIHRLLDLIECMDLLKAQPWWVANLSEIRSRYAGMDPRDVPAQVPTENSRRR